MLAEINLLPWRATQYKQQQQRAKNIYLIGLIIILILGCSIHFYIKRQVILLEMQIQKITLDLQNREPADNSNKFSTEELALDKKMHHQVLIFEIIRGIFHLSTQNIFLKEIKVKPNGVYIECRALELKAIQSFMSDILRIKRVHAVKLNYIQQASSSINFEIRIAEWE